MAHPHDQPPRAVSDAPARAAFVRQLLEKHGGQVRFDDWMAEALTHPEFGYYTTGIREIGRRGDFSTWPGMSSQLAAGIARWLRAHRPQGRRWNVVEVGAGNGSLAQDLLPRCGWWQRPRYSIVEISPKLRSLQQARLGKRVTWHEDPLAALAAAEGAACFVANELIDAFPCRVLRSTSAGWEELSVRVERGRAEEAWRPCGADRPDSSALQGEFPRGTRVEVHESFRHWLCALAPHWRQGRMLLIDYGDTCPAIYHRRPMGTLRAYAHHQRFTGRECLDGFGRRDITADVNFTDIEDFARGAGLHCAPLISLGSWLHRWGCDSIPAEWRPAAEAFKVLELCAGVEGGDS